jgi:rare lipoprotein A
MPINNASKSWIRMAAFAALLVPCAGCAPETAGRLEAESESVKELRSGLASYYDDDFEGERTASGEVFDNDAFVAAHPTYPPDTIVRVTNLENGRAVKVRIVDRGPTRENRREGVIIDLSRRAATRLGFIKEGRTRVRTEVLEWGEKRG